MAPDARTVNPGQAVSYSSSAIQLDRLHAVRSALAKYKAEQESTRRQNEALKAGHTVTVTFNGEPPAIDALIRAVEALVG